MKLTDIEKSYIAGLIDGEACVCLHKYKSYINHCWEYRFTCRIQVVMTCKKTMEYLSHKTCSKLTSLKNRTQSHYHLWMVCIHSKKAVELCKELLDFSITKKEQMKLLIEYGDTMFKSFYQKDVRGPRLPKEIYEKRLMISEKMKLLNQKGKNYDL